MWSLKHTALKSLLTVKANRTSVRPETLSHVISMIMSLLTQKQEAVLFFEKLKTLSGLQFKDREKVGEISNQIETFSYPGFLTRIVDNDATTKIEGIYGETSQ